MAASVVAQQVELESLRATAAKGLASNSTYPHQTLTVAEADTDTEDADKDNNGQRVTVHHDSAVEHVNGLEKNATESARPHQGQSDTQGKSAQLIESTGFAAGEGTVTRGLSSSEEHRDDVNAGVVNADIGRDTCIIHHRNVMDATREERSEIENLDGRRATGDIRQNFPGLSEDVRSKQMLQLLEWLISPPSEDPPSSPSAHGTTCSRPSHCSVRNDVLDSLRERMQIMIAAAASKQVEEALSGETGGLDQQQRDWAQMEGAWREKAKYASIGVGKRWGA